MTLEVDRCRAEGPATGALLLLPGALVVYLAFNAGGFFPGATGITAAALALALVLRITLARDPFEGYGPGLAIAASMLGLFGIWTLASGIWSDSLSHALLEFDRVLVYFLALVLFGLVGRTPSRVRRAIWGIAGAACAVALAAFVSRTLPDLLPTPATFDSRLSYPLTYWNALGLLMATGVVFSLHLAADTQGPRTARLLGAGGLPLLTATLLLTFSRGAIVIAILGVVGYLGLGRTRAMLPALLAVAVPCALAVVAAYGADLLATHQFTSAVAMQQGRHLALITGLSMLGALALRALLFPLDSRLARLEPPGRRKLMATATVLLACLAVALVAELPGQVSAQYDRFIQGDSLPAKQRDRLSKASNNGRLEHWRVALEAFSDHRLRGSGAGTYQYLWARDRRQGFTVSDGHSLYLEVLAELGLVGLALVGFVLVAILGAFAIRCTGRDRALYGASLAAGLAWALHAAVDWDWEMPAVTIWLFALGGLGLGRAVTTAPPSRPSRLRRSVLAGGLILVAIPPVTVAISQANLNESVGAFRAGDCDGAIEDARASRRAVPIRAEPFQIEALCECRRGHGTAAIAAMKEAVDRDPRNWEFRYTLAVVQGAAGIDPLPAAREALRLNPREPLAREGVRLFRTRDRRRWKSGARSARPPF